ncbi:hypothetical protein LCGC14_2654190, partial [marine sediment metagenome]
SKHGFLRKLGGGTANYLRADGTWAVPLGSGMVYPGAGIALSTGSAWGTSITNNSGKWNTAYTHSQVAGGNSVHVSVAENTAWDTAFGWGDHASGGYATASHAMATHSDETYYNISTSGTLGAGNATLGTIACGNTVVTGTLTSTGTVTIPTALTGVIRADSGVLSVESTAVVDADFGSAGILKTDGAGTYSILTDASGNWNTAFGWGDHSGQGYVAAHAILDGSVHNDSVADGVTRGSIIYGNATPKWDELIIGANGTVLTSDGTDISWAAAGGTDVKVGIDVGATADYLGALGTDGALRVTTNELTVADGGNFITLGLADHNTARTALGLAIGTDVAAAGANSDITSMTGITGAITTPTNLANKTTGTWSKSIGGTGDYADWATMIAAMPDLIAHAVTVTIEDGTTLTETCNLKNKNGLTTSAAITVQAEKYFPTSGAIPTADSATAT